MPKDASPSDKVVVDTTEDKGERAAKMVDSMADSAPPALQKYVKMAAPAIKMLVIAIGTVTPHIIYASQKAYEVMRSLTI